MSRPALDARRPRTRNGFVLFWVALFALSILMQYAGAIAPQRALAAGDCDSFAIFTTDAAGDTNNQNHYESKPEVFLNGGPTSAGGGLTAGTVIYYQVQEPDGTPLMEIRSTVIGPDGTFRVQLFPFDTTSNNGNEYKVVASTEADLGQGGCTKSDNFKVDGPGSLKVTKDVEGGPSDFTGNFDITVDCGESGTFNATIHFPGPGFVVIEGIDAKAECEVTEVDPPNAPDGFDWGDVTFTGNPATIESNKTVTVGITNHLDEVPAPALTVDKGVSLSADGPFTASLNTTVGTTVHYRITITNTGNVALTGVTLTDNTFDLAAKGCVIPTTLAVGAHFDCDYTAVATEGTTTNVATGDSAETDSDTGTATVVATPPGVVALAIEKTNAAPILNGLPTVEEGDLVAFNLAYTVNGGTAHNATIVDTLPDGLTYKTGSATNSAEFTFQGYDATARTLTWTAATVSANGSVGYQASVDAGAAQLEQPLTNVAVIDSDETGPDTDDSTLFVAPPVLAETAPPGGETAPPTDVAGMGGEAQPGVSLILLLGLLAGIVAVILMVTPTPAAFKVRGRKD